MLPRLNQMEQKQQLGHHRRGAADVHQMEQEEEKQLGHHRRGAADVQKKLDGPCHL